jgi:hypothetical protein
MKWGVSNNGGSILPALVLFWIKNEFQFTFVIGTSLRGQLKSGIM